MDANLFRLLERAVKDIARIAKALEAIANDEVPTSKHIPEGGGPR